MSYFGIHKEKSVKNALSAISTKAINNLYEKAVPEKDFEKEIYGEVVGKPVQCLKISIPPTSKSFIDFAHQSNIPVKFDLSLKKTHSKAESYRRLYCHLILSYGIKNNRFLIINPSMTEMHIFAGATFVFITGKDAYDLNRWTKNCQCGEECEVFTLSRSLNRIFICEKLSDIARTVKANSCSHLILNYIQPHLTNFELAQFMRVSEIPRGFSSFNLDIRDLTEKDYIDSSVGQVNEFDHGVKISTFDGGSAYSIDNTKNLQMFRPACSFDGAPLRITPIISSYSTHFVELELGQSGKFEAIGFRPAQNLYYLFVLKNINAGQKKILIKREDFDKLLTSATSLKIINFDNIRNLLRQKNLTYTLSGASLNSKLDLNSDEQFSLSVFLLIYTLLQKKAAEYQAEIVGAVKSRIIKERDNVQNKIIEEIETKFDVDLSFVGKNSSLKEAMTKKIFTAIGLNEVVGEQKSMILSYIDLIFDDKTVSSISEISKKNFENVLGVRRSISNCWSAYIAQHSNSDLITKKINEKSYVKQTVGDLFQYVIELIASKFDTGVKLLLKSLTTLDLTLEAAIDLIIFVLRFNGIKKYVNTLLLIKAHKANKTFTIATFVAQIRKAAENRPLDAIALILDAVITFKSEIKEIGGDFEVDDLEDLRWTGLLSEIKIIVNSIRSVDLRSSICLEIYDKVTKNFDLTKEEVKDLEKSLKQFEYKKTESGLETELPYINLNKIKVNGDLGDLNSVELGDSIKVGSSEIIYTTIEAAEEEILKNDELFIPTEKGIKKLLPHLSVKKIGGAAIDCPNAKNSLTAHLLTSNLTEDLVQYLDELDSRVPNSIALVEGFPMSGKSKSIRESLNADDMVIVPTRKLKGEWKRLYKNPTTAPKIATLYEALKFDCRGRVIVDECYAYRKDLLYFLERLGKATIFIGDKNQQPPHLSERPTINTKKFMTAVSFVPLDALCLFMERIENEKVYCLGPKNSIKVAKEDDLINGVDLAISCSNKGVIHLNSSGFNSITAMSSQGSRAEKALILFNEQELAAFKLADRSFEVAITRSRTTTILYGKGNLSKYSNLIDASQVNGLNLFEMNEDNDLTYEKVVDNPFLPDYVETVESYDFEIDVCTQTLEGEAILESECKNGEYVVEIEEEKTFCVTEPENSPISLSTSTLPTGAASKFASALEYSLRGRKSTILKSRNYKDKKIQTLFNRFEKILDFKKFDELTKIIVPSTSYLDKKPEQIVQFLQEDGDSSIKSTLSQSLNKASLPKKTVDLDHKPLKIQGVSANSKSIQLAFSAYIKSLQSIFALSLKPGKNVDLCLDDQDLHVLINQLNRRRGLKHEFDVVKQDANHSTEDVLVFACFLERIGTPEEIIELYLDIRSGERTYILQLNDSFWLATAMSSGAPWTLICNIIMMLTELLNSYDLSKVNFLQKGDDFSSDRLLEPIEPVYESTVEFEIKKVRHIQFTSKTSFGPIILRKYVKCLVSAIFLEHRSVEAEGIYITLREFFDEVNQVGIENYAAAVEKYYEVDAEFYLQLLQKARYVLENRSARIRDYIDETKIRIINTKERCVFNALLPFMPSNADKVMLYQNLNYDNVSKGDIKFFLRDFNLRIKYFDKNFEQDQIKCLYYNNQFDIYCFDDHMISKTKINYDYVDLFKNTMK